MKRVLVAAMAASVIALGACTDDDPLSPQAAAEGGDGFSGAADPVDSQYAVFADDLPAEGWELLEAVQMTGDAASEQLGSLPGLDWYFEFDGPVGDPEQAPPYLTLSGYTLALQELRDQLSETAETTEGEIGGNPAFWSFDPDDPDGGAVVTIAYGEDYSIELYATGVDVADLRAIAEDVRPATAEEWREAGGALADCDTEDADCPDTAEG